MLEASSITGRRTIIDYCPIYVTSCAVIVVIARALRVIICINNCARMRTSAATDRASASSSSSLSVAGAGVFGLRAKVVCVALKCR